MNPRALAISVLARVEATDAYLNAVLDDALRSAPQREARDAAFCTELCYGSTRRRLSLDAALAEASDRKLSKLEDRVLAALRIGVYQLFFMRVPARAAVDATVEALKELGMGRAASFVNAVLRKVARVDAPSPPQSGGALDAEALSLRESHPQWLVERWQRRHGPERAQKILEANNVAPPLVVRTCTRHRTREALLEELREAGLEVSPTAFSPVGIRLDSPGRVELLYGYAEGLWQVQDEAAQYVMCRAGIPPAAKVWDVCAAPGGKACQLAEQHQVFATDLSPEKLEKLRREAARLRLSDRIEASSHDARLPLDAAKGVFDAVVLDAPCSGLGTLRRHPELRYRRKEEDIFRLAALQRELLDAVCVRVRPGGCLVYVVCTTEPEEGRQQIDAFVARNSEFRRDVEDVLTLPDEAPWDGFFMAKLVRKTAV
ncbi:MAG: 16S rRNA (cytosine(967)-C(5))-methyltransferase RsmB [Myxococcaceae bacterium]